MIKVLLFLANTFLALLAFEIPYCLFARTSVSGLFRKITGGTPESRAYDKAYGLLMEHLSPFERLRLRALGNIKVPSKKEAGNTYVISGPSSYMVKVLVKGKPSHAFCIVPEYRSESDILPDPDMVLCQLLMTRHNERKFLETANRQIWEAA